MKANVGFALLTIVGCLRSAQAKPKIQITSGWFRPLDRLLTRTGDLIVVFNQIKTHC